MANPPHFGSSDPHRQRQGAYNNQPPVHQEYLAYQQSGQQFGFEYDGTTQAHNTSEQPLHYAPSLVPLDQQRRPHNPVNPSVDQVAPAITFDYAQTADSNPPRLPQGFYTNVDSNPSPSSLTQESGSSFSGFHPGSVENGLFLHLPQSEWPPGAASSSQHPSGPAGPSKQSRNGATPGKVPRHQFTACGACRHRRVKCDLRARQDEAEREAMAEDAQGGRRRKVSCTNCQERGTNCVDEYAPLKAAKQLRRGKRISEIEILYGKSATDAALASQGDDERSLSPNTKAERLPDLTREFFESPFFRRLIVQRPVIDPLEFVARYLSKPIPCAAAMGAEGAVLCHAIYAWAVSYGVDERGMLDVPEGGGEQLRPSNLLSASENELARDKDRQLRMDRMNRVVRTILREIDEFGLMRKPSWDGVRALLLTLPLTEGITTPLERQAMYQAALSHVHMLCTQQGQGYDGNPVSLPPSPVPDDEQRHRLVQMRIFWYAFVHEGVTTGLRGTALHLKANEDASAFVEALKQQPLLNSPGLFHPTYRMVTAPIRFSMACRMINECLTGCKARRRATVDAESLTAAWDMLDKAWEEFTQLKNDPPAPPFREVEEINQIADAWKISTYTAYHTVLTTLEERLEKLEPSSGSDPSRSGSPNSAETHNALLQLRHIRDLALKRCDLRVRQVVDLIREHASSALFEWDTSQTRDAVYYTALFLSRHSGSNDDLSLCLQVVNEQRWAYAKASERSQELRRIWFESHPGVKGSPFSSATDLMAASWPPSGTASRFSPTHEPPRSKSDPQVQHVKTELHGQSQSHSHSQSLSHPLPLSQHPHSHPQSQPHSHSHSPHGVYLDQQGYLVQQDGSPVFVPFTNPM